MERKIIVTEDGSNSILIPAMNVTYHSFHGSIQESRHIFIEAGLKNAGSPEADGRLSIFEMGFGTGLNALLSFIEAQKMDRPVYYETIELFPLNNEQIKSLNFCKLLQRDDLQKVFEQLHSCEWDKEISITSDFSFKKSKIDLCNFETSEVFDLIYFDAFDPNVQPELWTKEIFKKMSSMLEPGGILVTYSSKGNVRRAIQSAGFMVEKLPGPKGKREITRARRQNEP